MQMIRWNSDNLGENFNSYYDYALFNFVCIHIAFICCVSSISWFKRIMPVYIKRKEIQKSDNTKENIYRETGKDWVTLGFALICTFIHIPLKIKKKGLFLNAIN